MDYGSVILIVAAILAVVVGVGTLTRGKWGINLAPMKCPNCGAAVPRIRRPKSMRQAMWGGWTCEACGTEIDKWGNAAAK